MAFHLAFAQLSWLLLRWVIVPGRKRCVYTKGGQRAGISGYSSVIQKEVKVYVCENLRCF